jgi:hypothetical protein
MKVSFKIWILAMVYQTFIYAAMDQQAWPDLLLLLIPIELIGGTPSLFIYGAVLHYLHLSSYPAKKKWAIAIAGATFTALANAVLAVLFFGIAPSDIFDDLYLLFIPAPLAALLALFSFALSVNEYFNENTIKKNP